MLTALEQRISLTWKYRLNFPVLAYFRTLELLTLFCFIKHLHKLGLGEAMRFLSQFPLYCLSFQVLMVMLSKRMWHLSRFHSVISTGDVVWLSSCIMNVAFSAR